MRNGWNLALTTGRRLGLAATVALGDPEVGQQERDRPRRHRAVSIGADRERAGGLLSYLPVSAMGRPAKAALSRLVTIQPGTWPETSRMTYNWSRVHLADHSVP